MGWASGSMLLQEVAEIVMPHIPASNRPRVAEALIEVFQNADCDTINECEQTDIFRAYEKMYPSGDE